MSSVGYLLRDYGPISDMNRAYMPWIVLYRVPIITMCKHLCMSGYWIMINSLNRGCMATGW